MSFARSTAAPDPGDEALTARIIAAYQHASLTDLGSDDSFWLQDFAARKREIHDALIAGDTTRVRAFLRAPIESDLFYGFDNLTRSLRDRPTEPEAHAAGMLDQLAQLAEAIGVRRARSPEHPAEPAETEALLAALDRALGVKLAFPNPFPGEFGLASARGVISYRAVHAIYQAWRLRQLVEPGARVLEIGGGLGRTAFYARALGLRDYTLIDLPLTGVAQASFLGRVTEKITLFGEGGDGIAILPPESFFSSSNHYDIVLNADSLTEMAPATARAYCVKIAADSRMFLSMNHEVGRFRARDLFAAPVRARAPYWLRQGYVEELSVSQKG